MLDLFASLIGIIASALAEHRGLLAAVTLVVPAWLGRAVARRLSDRLGMPLGLLLAFLAVVGAGLWMYFTDPAPPGSRAAPPARAAREARRRQEWRRANAEVEQELNRMMWQGW